MQNSTDTAAIGFGEALRQAETISRLEGMEPDGRTHAIHSAILAGRVSSSQAVDELCEYAKSHQTLDGFIESRRW